MSSKSAHQNTLSPVRSSIHTGSTGENGPSYGRSSARSGRSKGPPTADSSLDDKLAWWEEAGFMRENCWPPGNYEDRRKTTARQSLFALMTAQWDANDALGSANEDERIARLTHCQDTFGEDRDVLQACGGGPEAMKTIIAQSCTTLEKVEAMMEPSNLWNSLAFPCGPVRPSIAIPYMP